MSPLRIFLGTADTAQCMTGLAIGFRELGHHVTTMVTNVARFVPEAQYDVMRGYGIMARYNYAERGSPLVRSVAYRLDSQLISPTVNALHMREYLDHDVFVFVFRPWLPEAMLFPLLKRLGKKIVFYYLGSDVRHITAFAQEFGFEGRTWQREFSKDQLDRKVRRLRHAELLCDAIYSVPDQAGLQIRPYFRSRVPLDVMRTLSRHVPARREPIVVHAPSREDVKGTSTVVRAVEQLKREGLRFEFRLLSGVPRAVVLETLREADILVDELVFHGPGVLSAEAMASGCAVATRVLDAQTVFDPPCARVLPETLTDELRRLIVDVEHRVDVANRGHAWAKTEFDPLHVARHVIDEGLAGAEPPYRPSFYLERFRPPKGYRVGRRARALSTEVTERFRPDALAHLPSAARRGLVASR